MFTRWSFCRTVPDGITRGVWHSMLIRTGPMPTPARKYAGALPWTGQEDESLFLRVAWKTDGVECPHAPEFGRLCRYGGVTTSNRYYE